jgi:chromosome segregation ATPase
VVTVAGPGKLATLESQREEARTNYDAMLNRVIAIDNWPVVPPADHENRESLSKMTKYCEDLQRNAEEINRILSRSTSIVPATEVQTGDSARPLKRARTEEDGQDGEPARQATAEIEELRDRVLAMHSTITSIQNDQIAMRNDLMTEYKEYVDTKFDETTAEVGKQVQSVEDKAKALEHSINSTGDDVGELAGDVEHLILDNDAFRAEIAETNQRIKETQ